MGLTTSMMTLLTIPFVVLILTVVIPLLWVAEVLNLIGAILSLVTVIHLLLILPHDPQVILSHFYIDHLGCWVLLCTALVYCLASIYSIGYMRAENKRKGARYYYSLFSAFAFVMFLAGTMNSLLFYWIAIDLTTLVSTFLICFKPTAESVEASWKYLIVVLAGLSLALLGITLLQWGSVIATGQTVGITWASFTEQAPKLEPHLLILAYLLVICGFATKVGLAPMHTWLPDAHSEGPAPASAMLSGALLNTAMLSVVRLMNGVSLAGFKTFAHLVPVSLGLLSLLIAAFSLKEQKIVKRLMAYSSLEHMGVIGMGFGFGGLFGVAGSMYHMLGHSLTKALLFFGCGNVIHAYKSHRIEDMRGVLRLFPRSGLIWVLGALAITGAPPAALFLSEFMIIRGGLLSSNPWAVFVMLVVLIVIFSHFLGHFKTMFFSDPPEALIGHTKISSWCVVPMVLAVIPIYLLGVWWPHPFWEFFKATGEQLRGLL